MFKVLIVDDTKSVHSFVRTLLSRSKEIDFVSVYNGSEAVELLKQRQDFDLIFLDWEMPVMSGPEAFAEFKKLGVRAPTIMMTSKNAVEDITMMLEMGVSEYMMKPFTMDILFEKIEFVTGKALSHVA